MVFCIPTLLLVLKTRTTFFGLKSPFLPLHENCPYSGFFWFAFSHMWTVYGEILYISVFSPNVGKYGPEKLPIWTFFTQCTSSICLQSKRTTGPVEVIIEKKKKDIIEGIVKTYIFALPLLAILIFKAILDLRTYKLSSHENLLEMN